jgi:Uma2 family endonuclease
MQAIVSRTMVSLPVVTLRYQVGRSPDAWELPEGPVPESTAHDAALYRICSLLRAWAARTANGARISRNLAIRWIQSRPSTGLDPDVAVLLPGPQDFDDLSSYKLWEPDRPPPPFAVEVVSKGHPYKDYSWVHEGYAAMGMRELLVFDPLLFGPRSLGPVVLQLWRRDPAGVFERVHFGSEPVYSEVLQAWLSANGRDLCISDDRAGLSPWPTLEEAAAGHAKAEANQAKAEADHAKAEADHAKAEAERARAEAEREKALRAELEQRLVALERQRQQGPGDSS